MNDRMYSAGILWNMSDKFAREIMKTVAIDMPVIQIRTYDLRDKLEQFICDCYSHDKEAISKGYVQMKIDHLKECNHSKIVAFITEISNPTYNEQQQCIEARNMKSKIRTDFSKKMDNYFYDVLIHMSDNEIETKRLIDVFERYSEYKESEYLRRAREPIIKGINKDKSQKTYIGILRDVNNMYTNNEDEEPEI